MEKITTIIIEDDDLEEWDLIGLAMEKYLDETKYNRKTKQISIPNKVINRIMENKNYYKL